MSSETPTSSPTTTSTTTPLPPPILTLPNSITIRPWHPTDTPHLSHHANNRLIWLNLTDRFPHPYTPNDASSWISHCLSATSHLPSHHTTGTNTLLPSNYAICLSDLPIGAIGLEADPKHTHVMALGYWLSQDHWGKGIATIAAGAFLRWSFDVFPWLVRVSADAYSWNEGSMRVLRKIGMECEGRLRMAVCKDGRLGDLVLFGAVREGVVVGEGETWAGSGTGTTDGSATGAGMGSGNGEVVEGGGDVR